MEVEHVKAHRTEKDKKELSCFEKFVTEGNEKADELAKESAMRDEGVVLSQELEVQTCGSENLGIITGISQKKKRHLGGSGTCEGTPHEERKRKMTQFERFVAEGNEKADELAKEGALLDEGFMAQTRAKTVKEEREELYAALQNATSFHCLDGRGMERLRRAQAAAKRKMDLRGQEK